MKLLYLRSNNRSNATVDRRRFISYINNFKNIKIEHEVEKNKIYDVVIVGSGGDLRKAAKLRKFTKYLIIDYANHYLVENNIIKNRARPILQAMFLNFDYTLKSYKKLITDVFKVADTIIVSSSAQLQYLKKLNFKSYVLTDFFHDEINFLKPNFKRQVSFNSLMWEGQSSNITNLNVLKKVLNKKRTLKLNVVTDEFYGFMNGRILKKNTKSFLQKNFINYSYFKWSQKNLINTAFHSQLGVIPIDKSKSIYASKPENKIVLMWLLGLPIIGTDIQSYLNLEKRSNIKCTCSSIQEWEYTLEKYYSNPKLITDDAKQSYDYACKEYSSQKIFNQWHNVLQYIHL